MMLTSKQSRRCFAWRGAVCTAVFLVAASSCVLGDTDARVGRRLVLPPQYHSKCMTCEWTSENPTEPHGHGCRNAGDRPNARRNPSRIPAQRIIGPKPCKYEAGTEACKARQDALSKQIKETRTKNAELRQRENMLSFKRSNCRKIVEKKTRERDELINKLHADGSQRISCQSGFMHDDMHDDSVFPAGFTPFPVDFPDCCRKRMELSRGLGELFFYHDRLEVRVEGTDMELKCLEDSIHRLTRECQKLQESLSELSTKGQREVNAPNMPSEERDQAENTWLEFWKTL